ncbi:DUF2062 domain-containing protein [Cohaesibacter celericrescens]|uniref:DUF2062 domain-containing protein n=1 Tax=Cohaesibacter celericrescens TaxID=2067669 RepID=A0A2N5XRD2_9HYPH|nr:DUF2062 domain-containing protein [Cohaesibacter celericrescens]PLW77071.1 DUF2062 domain-containing protein [Cohaesibacter celericrescens]
MRVLLWPRRNWLRSGKYFIKRILRLSGSPYMIAAGVAAGVFTSFTPFLGLHFIISWAIAFLIGGNLLAAAIGTGVGNPITFPFIWGATYWTGCFILGKEVVHGQLHHLKHQLLTESFSTILPTIEIMAVGAIPVGLAFALLFYFFTRRAAVAYQHRRKASLARKAFQAGRWRKAIAEHDLGSPDHKTS